MRIFLLLTLACLLIMLYVYFLFIFKRPVRDIPFHLMVWNFYSLIIILLIQCYLFYKSFKPSTSQHLRLFIQKRLSWILEALIIWDNRMKIIPSIKKPYDFLLINFLRKVTIDNLVLWKIILTTLSIGPRIILLTIFIIDVFYFKQLHYIYNFIWLTILPYLVYYLIRCLRMLNESLIAFLEENVESIDTTYVQGILPPEEDYWNDAYIFDEDEPNEEPPSEMRLPVRRFLEYRWSCIKQNSPFKNDPIHCRITSKYYYEQKYAFGVFPPTELSREQVKELYLIPKKKIIEVMKIHQILEIIKNTMMEISQNKNIWATSLLILWLYFLTWSYIFIVSVPSLNVIDLMESFLRISYIFKEEPFSEISLHINMKRIKLNKNMPIDNNNFFKQRCHYCVRYQNPHETSGESYNSKKDAEMTKGLQKRLTESQEEDENNRP